MRGSGLKELLLLIYCEKTVDNILNGHSYSKGIRALLLASSALMKILFQSCNITIDEGLQLKKVLDNENVLEEIKKPEFQTIYKKFLAHIEAVEKNGPTAKQWIMFLKMNTILRMLVESDRNNNWELHVESCIKMLPFFLSCGHLNYAKSMLLYLLDMLNLKNVLSTEEYERFIKYFSIYRSDRPFSGTGTDMIIEQEFMKNFKCRGGLTHGRGTDDATLSRWIITMPFLIDLIKLLEAYTGTGYVTSQQHKDTSDARNVRDKEDTKKMYEFFLKTEPLSHSDLLVCITTGLAGDKSINCHNAYEHGMELLKKTFGKQYGEIKFKRNDKVNPLSNMTAITAAN